jgi:hypothetical protein
MCIESVLRSSTYSAIGGPDPDGNDSLQISPLLLRNVGVLSERGGRDGTSDNGHYVNLRKCGDGIARGTSVAQRIQAPGAGGARTMPASTFKWTMNRRTENSSARRRGFKLESVKSGAHESGAGFSAGVRTNPIRHGGWRRLAPRAVHARGVPHSPGFFASRPDDQWRP